jgi:hypothetical protein
MSSKPISQSLRLALSTDRRLLCVSIELQGGKSMIVIRWSTPAGRVRCASNESNEDGTKSSKHFHDAARHILGASDGRSEPRVLATQPRAQLSLKMTEKNQTLGVLSLQLEGRVDFKGRLRGFQ